MSPTGRLPRGEALRKVVHVGCVGFALTLRVLPWPAALALAMAALGFNALVLPRLGGAALLRDGERARGWSAGILWYPASIALVVLLFRERLDVVAGAWGLLAVGDGMATVVGRGWGRHALPWNPRKTWEGVLAHVVLGGLAAWGLVLFVGARGAASDHDAMILLGISLGAALLTAVLESSDLGADDNVLVAVAGAVALWYGGLLAATLPAADSALIASRLAWAVPLCGALAWTAAVGATVTPAGAIAAALLGIVVSALGGPWALGVLLLFFALGSAATRMGRRVKEARGIAQERGGRRGIPNVVANGGVAGLCAAIMLPAGPDGGRWVSSVIVAFTGALATAAADTVSSEIGKAFGKRTFVVTTLRPVPPGTEGAVSLEGTLAGVVASALVAALGAAWILQAGMDGGPTSVVVAVVAGAFAGTTFESVVGAITDRHGAPVDSHLLNFANTAVGAVVAAGLFAQFLG